MTSGDNQFHTDLPLRTPSASNSLERKLSAFNEFANAILNNQDLETLCQSALYILGRELSCNHSTVFLHDIKTPEPRLFAATGWNTNELSGRLHHLYHHHQLTGAEGIGEFAITLVKKDSYLAQSPLFVKHGVTMAMSAALPWKKGKSVSFCVYSRRATSFTPADIHFFKSICKLLSSHLSLCDIIENKLPIMKTAVQAKYEWESTVDAVPEIILLVDTMFRVIRANKTVEIWGLGTVDEIKGMGLHDIIHPGCLQKQCAIHKMLAEMRHSLATQGQSELETRFILGKDLRIFAKRINAEDKTPDSLIIDASYAIFTFEDISTQQTIKRTLITYNKKLQEDIQKRTNQLKSLSQNLEQQINEQRQMQSALLKSKEQLQNLSIQIVDAQENERKRIASELHDGIGQSLSATKFVVEELIRSCALNENQHNIAKLHSVVDKIKHTVDEVRRISMDLRPSILDDLGLIATIRWFCREFQECHSGITVEQIIDIEEEQIAAGLSINIYRLVQEAFNNIAKHSGATYVVFTLGIDNSNISLTIKDNGRGIGFDKNDGVVFAHKGIGLVSMAERAQLYGGHLDILTAPNTGVTIVVKWPVKT